MPSFDAVLEPNLVEVRNAVDQAAKEIGTRFDFKGSSARIEQKEKELTLYADSEFQIGQVMDILLAKLSKRNVDARYLDRGGKVSILAKVLGHGAVEAQTLAASGLVAELGLG